MEKLTEAPDRRPLSAVEARSFAKERLAEWQEIPALARELCERGRGDQRHEIVVKFGVWPIAHTMNFDSGNPQGTGIDCETGEFSTVRGWAVPDEEVAHAATMACGVDGRLVLRQVRSHLERSRPRYLTKRLN